MTYASCANLSHHTPAKIALIFTKPSVLLINFIFFTKSSVVLREFITFYKIIRFTKRIYHFLYMDDNGTYLGNIYGIYKECITNISINIYDIQYKIITHTHRRRLRRRPNGAAAFGGRPIGSVCLMDIFMDIYDYIINIYVYISYTFLIYSIYIS